MARGTEIIVSANPRGVEMEGTIAAAQTPSPGTIMQIQDSAGMDDNGRFTWEPFTQGQNGSKSLLIVLLPDRLQGKLETDAYAAAAHCFGYVPVAGEEFNILVLNLSGTADDHTFGEELMVNDGDGKLVVRAGTPESTPFKLLEAITDPTADTLAHVLYTGY